MTTVLEARKLVKQYPGVLAVDELSFEVEEGICFGLLGPNGAGKTTTVEIIEGVTPATSGEVFYFGKPAGARFREEAGIQFQNTALQDYLTVKETIEMFQSLYNRQANLDHIIEECSLGGEIGFSPRCSPTAFCSRFSRSRFPGAASNSSISRSAGWALCSDSGGAADRRCRRARLPYTPAPAMKVIEHLERAKGPLISFEIIPPLRGANLRKLLQLIEDLAKYRPPFIDITSHSAELIYHETKDGIYYSADVVGFFVQPLTNR